MTLDPSMTFHLADEDDIEHYYPNYATNDFSVFRTNTSNTWFRSLQGIQPKSCKSFYVEIEKTATSSPDAPTTLNNFVIAVGPGQYWSEGTQGTTFSVFEGPHQGWTAGIASGTSVVNQFKRAEGNLSGSSTQHQMTARAWDPDNTINGLDMETNGDYIGLLIDFDSPYGNLTCNVSVFYNGENHGSFPLPVADPEEKWHWGILASHTTGADRYYEYQINNDALSYNMTPPKGAIPWELPFATSSYSENQYCRFVHAHVDTQENYGAETRLSNNSLKVEQLFTDVTTTNYSLAYGTKARGDVAGKYYFEVTTDWTESDYSNPAWIMGLACSDNDRTTSITLPQPTWFFALASNIGSALYRQRFGFSDLLTNGQVGSLRPVTANDVFMFAINFTNPNAASAGSTYIADCWVGKNGTWHSGNPSTLTSPSEQIRATAFNAPIPVVQFHTQIGDVDTNRGFEFNFGGSAFAYTIPTGFSAWDSTTVPTDGF